MMKMLSLILLGMISTPALATASFYTGKISRLWAHDPKGGFVITFSGNSSLSDCNNQYGFFQSDSMQPEILRNSLTLALSAFHTDSTVGVVIDKKGPGERCDILSIDIRK